MTIDKETTTLERCPECGGPATKTVIEASQLVWNPEETDGVENVRLSPGYWFECHDPKCGFGDAEPPTY